MKLTMFEGTPEEYVAIANTLMGTANTVVAIPQQSPAVVARRFVTLEEAKEILSRLELSDNMNNVLVALYKAGSKRLTSDDLKKVNGHNSDEFRGMMGAFGRRVGYTIEGNDIWFFDQKWEGDAYTYTLPESARKAMEEHRMVKQ